MASLQILKSPLSQVPVSSHSSFSGKSNWVSSSRKRILKLRGYRRSWSFLGKRLRVSCGPQDDDSQSNGEEAPESLFMKELRKRGMTSTSLLEETDRGNSSVEDEMSGVADRNAVSTEIEKSLANQRERSMALNSEGLEGLIPRAKALLTLGVTFFLAFGPLILITVAFFSAVYLYFGQSFVHDASNIRSTPPQYIDPYSLLDDERIS